MKCTYCGQDNEETAVFCENCGKKLHESFSDRQTNFNQTASPINSNMQTGAYGQPFMQNQNGYGQMKENDFYERFASKTTKTWVMIRAIGCFLSALLLVNDFAINSRKIKLAMMLSDEIKALVVISVIKIVFFIVMGILLLVMKKWFLALILIAEQVISIIMKTIILGGLFETIGEEICFTIIAVIYIAVLKRVNDAYKIYKKTGRIPEKPI